MSIPCSCVLGGGPESSLEAVVRLETRTPPAIAATSTVSQSPAPLPAAAAFLAAFLATAAVSECNCVSGVSVEQGRGGEERRRGEEIACAISRGGEERRLRAQYRFYVSPRSALTIPASTPAAMPAPAPRAFSFSLSHAAFALTFFAAAPPSLFVPLPLAIA